MAKKTSNNAYAVLTKFEAWYKEQGIKRSYASNLKSVQGDIYNYLKGNPWNTKKGSYEYHVRQFAVKTILNSKRHYDFIEAVDSLLKEGDLLYAKTIVDGMIYMAEKFKKAIIAYNKGKNTFNDKCSALKKFREYLETDLSALIVAGSYNNNIYRKDINKPMLSKIDGIDALAKEIGEDKFIRMAIEQSYFFDKDIVNEQMKELIDLKNEGKPLPARKTTKNGESAEDTDYHHEKNGTNTYYIEGNVKILINLSNDGNDFVRSLITKKTEYTVGAGKDNIFQNYIISHLWGRAYDPRYYTNLWNIVLVPAWANSLLDKTGEEGSLASKLKATFMEISKNWYNFSECKWEDLEMSEPMVTNINDVKHGKYKIKILGRSVGIIKTEPITI